MNEEKPYLRLLYLFLIALQTCWSLSLSHENLVKHPGDTFLVTCSDDAKRLLVWTGPKGALSNETNPRVEPPASYGTSVRFTKVTVKEGGDYTCSAGGDTKVLKLIIEASLRFVDTPETQSASEYTDATLRCEVAGGNAEGHPPIITWSNERNNFSSLRYAVIGDGLVIKNVSRLDSGMYTCTAMQPSTGDLIEQKIYLRVQHKPVGVNWTKEEAVWGYMGGEANLSCEVLAEPPATFQWFWQKKAMHVGKVHNTTNKSILQVHLKDPKMFGKHMCQASNQFGSLNKIFTLQQGLRPVTPDFVEIREVTANHLEFGIHQKKRKGEPEKMQVLGYGVKYRQRGDQGWTFQYFPFSKENNYTLKDLQKGIYYEVKVATVNPTGYSYYTNTTIFRTPNAPTSAATTTSMQTKMLIPVLILTCW